jgi:hypothetical protein
MAVPGAQARVVEVVGGVALELVTDGSQGDVEELRRRVVAMSERGTMGRMAGPSGGQGGRGTMRTGPPAPATERRVEAIARGERVTLLARDPRQVDALRARAQAHAAKMSGGRCAEGRLPR